MLIAEQQFRRIHRLLAISRSLVIAIERRLHLPQPNPATNQEAAIAVTV